MTRRPGEVSTAPATGRIDQLNMKAVRSPGIALLSALALATSLSLMLTPLALAQAAPPEPPTLPDVTPVALDPATTAYLVLDITPAVCPPRPACLASVPAISRLLARARTAGVFVAFSATAGGEPLADVAPRADEPVVSSRADKFFNTNLD